jgi:hypothetical protein
MNDDLDHNDPEVIRMFDTAWAAGRAGIEPVVIPDRICSQADRDWLIGILSAMVRDTERSGVLDAEPSTAPVFIGARQLDQRDVDSRHALLRSLHDGIKQHIKTLVAQRHAAKVSDRSRFRFQQPHPKEGFLA